MAICKTIQQISAQTRCPYDLGGIRNQLKRQLVVGSWQSMHLYRLLRRCPQGEAARKCTLLDACFAIPSQPPGLGGLGGGVRV